MTDTNIKKATEKGIMIEKQKELDKEIKKLTKEIQLELTKFLINKKCCNPKDIAKLWSLNVDTAKEYINEAKKVTFDNRAEPDIEKIKIEKKVSWIDAVALYYKQLMTPRCGYGAGIQKRF